MKSHRGIIIGIICTIALVWLFDFQAIALFITIGIVPGTDISLAPSTMLAIMTASFVMLSLRRRWSEAIQAGEELYDAFRLWRKKSPAANDKPHLPRRRFGRI